MYKVVEKFVSINGEGQKSGELSVFIRLAGCNLSCVYCDTKWANTSDVKYDLMDKYEIYDYIKSTEIKNVTLTGGEPLLAKGVKDLIQIIVEDSSLYLEIETNGSVSIEPFRTERDNLSFTLDYKSPSSQMNHLMNMSNYKYLKTNDTLKFVVASILDLDQAFEVINTNYLSEKCKVYISPVFKEIEPITIVDYMIKQKCNGARLQLQMHKIIWDPSEKGV